MRRHLHIITDESPIKDNEGQKFSTLENAVAEARLVARDIIGGHGRRWQKSSIAGSVGAFP